MTDSPLVQRLEGLKLNTDTEWDDAIDTAITIVRQMEKPVPVSLEKCAEATKQKEGSDGACGCRQVVGRSK